MLIVPPAGVNLQAFLRKGSESDQALRGKAMRVPCEVCNDLLQPVLITNDHAATVDEILGDFSLIQSRCGQESSSGDLYINDLG
jgi:hypothetical protein